MSRTVSIRTACVLVLVALASLLTGLPSGAPSKARAQDVAGRTLGVRWVAGVPQLHFSARDLLTPALRRKLDSGLPQNVALRVYAYRQGDARTPIAVAPLSCRITRDFLEERYRVQVQSVAGDRTEAIATLDGVLRRCLEMRGLPVGSERAWAGQRGARVYFAVLVEFNPLSPDTVRRIRRWLADSGGGPVQNDAFFGSFVSLFVNRRIGSAERAISFQSQPVRVP